jgi:uncharacterized protein (DUF1330 family)
VKEQLKKMGFLRVSSNIVFADRQRNKRREVAKAIADSGGKFLVRGGKTVPMHGTPPAQRVVIVQFESLEKAEAWANSAASNPSSTLRAGARDISY